VALSGRANPTVRDFVEFTKCGTLSELPVFVGDSKSVADQMGQWHATACDAFDTSQNRTDMPGVDFSRWLQPVAIAAVIVFSSDASTCDEWGGRRCRLGQG
jgi:hypothetical protein